MNRYSMFLAALLLLGCGSSDSAAPSSAESASASEDPSADSASEPGDRAEGDTEPEPEQTDPPPPSDGTDPELQLIASMARAIRANPADAEKIVTDANYTLDNFRELVVEIAADPERSAAYAAALK
jgi:hypothetical protein